MLKKKITYVDYNGEERSEDFYFNLNKAELLEMSFSKEGGLEHYVEKIIKSQSGAEIMALFKEIICKAYGEKSFDGKRFIKSQELTEQFTQTEAYAQLYVELASNPDKAAEFINAVGNVKPNPNAVAPASVSAIR